MSIKHFREVPWHTLLEKKWKNYAIWCILKCILVKQYMSKHIFITITHINYLNKEQNCITYKKKTQVYTLSGNKPMSLSPVL